MDFTQFLLCLIGLAVLVCCGFCLVISECVCVIGVSSLLQEEVALEAWAMLAWAPWGLD